MSKSVNQIVPAPPAPPIPPAIPTARVQIGKSTSIEIDTAMSNGKKSIRLQIVSDDDTIQKNIEDVVEEIKAELKDEVSSEENSGETLIRETYRTQIEEKEMKYEHLENIMGISIPILTILLGFGAIAIRSIENRKWKESLLMKGHSLDEIQKLTAENSFFRSSGDEVKDFEKRRTIKWAIVLLSIGIAIFMGSFVGPSGFFGSLALCLAGGLFYYYNKVL